MASDLIYRDDAKVFVRHACYKKINPIDYLDEVPAADVRPESEISDAVYEAMYFLNSVSAQMPYHVYSALFDLIVGILPTCGADMREPNLDTTKGVDHD